MTVSVRCPEPKARAAYWYERIAEAVLLWIEGAAFDLRCALTKRRRAGR